MSLQLNVPLTESDEAKARGVLWDPNLKTWYLPQDQYGRLMEVDKWIPEKDTAIILSNEVTVAHAERPCWKCGHPNKVIAIGSNYFYEKDINERDEPVWLEQGFFTLFQQIATVSDNLQTLLRDHYPHYSKDYAKATGTSYWNNHCETCQQVQGDWHLFDEPGSVFYPTNPETAAHILLKTFQLKYAPRIDAGYSYGDHLRLITEFAGQGSNY
ncbi:MAG TPA: DUF5710 domain-containing protein [Chitinophaga sp.]|uniref:DUF5710 domain-containing protein n=1 Tax=Chitinophaga sp. TaxID=1869181 RepID=UPI002C9A65D8|nr:DUF5710 domain-containing protein [Chitinophaga sp.]HVI46760.1 DUF5710 domain-containing protein [Chitinophaga sp.]